MDTMFHVVHLPIGTTVYILVAVIFLRIIGSVSVGYREFLEGFVGTFVIVLNEPIKEAKAFFGAVGSFASYDNDEFVTADTEDFIIGEGFGDQFCALSKDEVTSRMAIVVVHVFKEVNVEHDDAKGGFLLINVFVKLSRCF